MKIGFVGGNGHHYLRGILGRAEVNAIAVASDGHDRPAAENLYGSLKESFPNLAVTWFDSFTQLCDDFRPDIASVGAVYGYNGDCIAEALTRDIPTVSDKPVAATWAQLERLESLIAEKPSRVLLTEFDFRCRRDIRAAKEAVAQGRIGKIVLASGQKSYRFGTRPPWYADRQPFGGTLLWVASHAIDGIAFITAQELTEFAGRQGNISRPEMGTMEDHTVILAGLSGGGSAVVHADFLRPAAAEGHGDDRIRIVGERGIIEIFNYRALLLGPQAAAIDITNDIAPPRPLAEELFAAAQGEASPYFSTAESLKAARTLLRARDAADKGIA